MPPRTQQTDPVQMPEQESTRLRKWVARCCSPRRTMTLVLFLTGTIGSLASFTLLNAGVTHFCIRYALAVLIAYGALIGLLALWGQYEARRYRRNDNSSARSPTSNLLDRGGDVWPQWDTDGPSAGDGAVRGGGGRFGGGGASSSFSNTSSVATSNAILGKGGSGECIGFAEVSDYR